MSPCSACGIRIRTWPPTPSLQAHSNVADAMGCVHWRCLNVHWAYQSVGLDTAKHCDTTTLQIGGMCSTLW